ncbi:hypothetical protein IJS77_02880 [bacterium]|nr:hypothetical protein [bacterium]
MKINSVSPNFSGKYILNINQKLKDYSCYHKRDFLFAMWSAKANNHEDLSKNLKSYLSLYLSKDKDKPVIRIFDIPDELDTYFETDMKKVGQKFEKLG